MMWFGRKFSQGTAVLALAPVTFLLCFVVILLADIRSKVPLDTLKAFPG
jgi:hypothetical protein